MNDNQINENVREQLSAIEFQLHEQMEIIKKTHKYVVWFLIGSIVMALLPIVLALLVVPFLLSTLSAAYPL